MGEETPWALVQRMKAEGVTLERIVKALGGEGLTADDVEVLLMGEDGYRRGFAEQVLGLSPARQTAVVREEALQAYDLRGFKRGLTRLLLFFSLPVAIFSAVALLSFQTSSVLWMTLGISGSVAGFAAVLLLRWSAQPGVLPTLASQMPLEALCEIDGIQFTVLAPQISRRGVAVELRFLMQNCVDAERRVSFELSALPALQDSARWRFPPSVKGTLGPGEIAELTVVGIAGPEASPALDLWVVPSASGPIGRRVRVQEARGYEAKVALADTAMLAVIGVISFGGGYRVRLGLSAEPALDEWIAPLPQPRWRVLESPTPELLSRALKG